MEADESVEETAIREVREETGFEVELDALLGVDVIYLAQAGPAGDDLRGLRIIYRAHIVGGVLEIERDGTTDGAEWFLLSDVDGLECVELVGAAMAMMTGTRAK
jgi:8-oxo-dGTP diphosphatase